MLRFLVGLGCVAWMLALAGWLRAEDSVGEWRPGAPGAVIGPSAMLEWQRRGGLVFDLRRSGRFVSHTIKVGASNVPRNVPRDRPVLVIAPSRQDALRCSPRALWVPARLLEIPLRQDVRQLSPQQAFERARRGEIEIVDVSEAQEWAWERLPFGRRVDWRRVLSRDRSWISRGKPVVFACRLGGRSQIAARTLAREGYSTANLAGGVWGWQASGLPIARGTAGAAGG